MEKREHYTLEPKLIEQAIFVGFAFSGPQKKEKKNHNYSENTS